MSTVTPHDLAMRIIADIAHRHRIGTRDIFGRSKLSHFIAARQEAYLTVAKANPTWSTPRLGRLFGRVHSTMVSAFQKFSYFHPGSAPNRSHRASPPTSAPLREPTQPVAQALQDRRDGHPETYQVNLLPLNSSATTIAREFSSNAHYRSTEAR